MAFLSSIDFDFTKQTGKSEYSHYFMYKVNKRSYRFFLGTTLFLLALLYTLHSSNEKHKDIHLFEKLPPFDDSANLTEIHEQIKLCSKRALEVTKLPSPSLSKVSEEGEIMFSSSPKQVLAPQAEPEYLHFILMYPKLHPIYLCPVESLILSLKERSRKESSVHIMVWIPSLSVLEDPDVSSVIKGIAEMLQSVENREISLHFKILSSVFSTTMYEEFFDCVEKNKINMGRFGPTQKTDAVRLAIIKRFGGFYLDSDFLILNDPTVLENGFGAETIHSFNNAAIKFNPSSFALEFLNMMEISYLSEYRADVWIQQGPGLLGRMLSRYCTNVSKKQQAKIAIEGSTIRCFLPRITKIMDVSLWPIRALYWVSARARGDFFKDYERMSEKYFKNNIFKSGGIVPEDIKALHLWHSLVQQPETIMCLNNYTQYKSSFLGKLRSEFCPVSVDPKRTTDVCSF